MSEELLSLTKEELKTIIKDAVTEAINSKVIYSPIPQPVYQTWPPICPHQQVPTIGTTPTIATTHTIVRKDASELLN